uniref:Uncharacterized protein n=1 Tax=Arundo donax TaxID=35708 RepID=A0A0A9BQD6_ARUDO
MPNVKLYLFLRFMLLEQIEASLYI